MDPPPSPSRAGPLAAPPSVSIHPPPLPARGTGPAPSCALAPRPPLRRAQRADHPQRAPPPPPPPRVAVPLPGGREGRRRGATSRRDAGRSARRGGKGAGVYFHFGLWRAAPHRKRSLRRETSASAIERHPPELQPGPRPASRRAYTGAAPQAARLGPRPIGALSQELRAAATAGTPFSARGMGGPRTSDRPLAACP